MTTPGRVTPRLGTIVALDAGETFELSRAQVKQIRAQYPEVVNAIIEMFSQEVRARRAARRIEHALARRERRPMGVTS